MTYNTNHQSSLRAMNRAVEMKELFLQGMTLGDIAEKYGITRQRVHQVMARLGVNRTEGGCGLKVKQFAQTVAKEHAEGLSQQEIANKYGVSDVTVSRALRSLDEEQFVAVKAAYARRQYGKRDSHGTV